MIKCLCEGSRKGRVADFVTSPNGISEGRVADFVTSLTWRQATDWPSDAPASGRGWLPGAGTAEKPNPREGGTSVIYSVKAPYLLVIVFNQFGKRIMQSERRATRFSTVLHCLKEFAECVKEKVGINFIPFVSKAAGEKVNCTFEQEEKFQLEVDNYYNTCN